MVIETTSQFVANTLGLLPWEPPAPKRGPRFGADDRCWLCGGSTDGVGWPRKTAVAPTFTNVNLAVVPASQTMCQACVAVSSGDTWRAYAEAHPNMALKYKHPLSWRTYSHLIAGGLHVCPVRTDWRPWLLNPPAPPFVAVVSESGQKHLLFRAAIAYDRDVFPVQIEEDRVLLDRARFAECLQAFEALYRLGCSKDEIRTGHYHQGKLLKLGLTAWHAAEQVFAPWRLSDPDDVRLAAWVASKEETE